MKTSKSQNQIWLNVASSCYLLEDYINLDNHWLAFISRYTPFIARQILTAKE